jgi:two-component system phosphate regulon response regulator PhoB
MQQLQIPISLQEMSKDAERPLALIIDDKLAIRDMLSWMLHLQGYQATGIKNGQAAIDWLDSAQHTGNYPSVILLDLLMPIERGSKLLEHMRAHWVIPVPFPPTILLTVVKNDFAYLRCTDVLVKPFHFADLCESLKLATRRSNPNII